jgi:3-oxoacyl-[acyl-carrier protein] reductase
MLNIDFSGRIAVVTGGSRGIGRATAMLLARAGADVAITFQSRRIDADRTLEALRQCGIRCFAHEGDLADPCVAQDLIDRVRRTFGRLDFFIGNAGIWEPAYAALGDMTYQQWRRTQAANLDSIFFSTRAAIRVIANHGRIVLVSFTAGQRGEAGHADYAASKGAIISMVKGLAVELGDRDITVNAVAPGWVDTEMAAKAYHSGGRERIVAGIPLRRVAAAEDVAGPIVFLCTEYAKHISGEILNVNGGAVLCG